MPKKKKGGTKTRADQLDQKINAIANSAIEYGINAIIEHHPRFDRGYLLRYIDKNRLSEKLNEIYQNLRQNQGLSNEKKINYLHHELANYVASGQAFNDKGKQIILKESLEEKAKSGFLRGFFARRELKGEKYLDRAFEFFQEMYYLAKSGEFAQRMPELTQRIMTGYELTGFIGPAANALRDYGVITSSEYRDFKKKIRRATERSVDEVRKGIVEYPMPYQKIAASILGLLGIFIIFSSKIGITGNVIGNLSNTGIGLIGGFLVLISLILFLNSFKKKE